MYVYGNIYHNLNLRHFSRTSVRPLSQKHYGYTHMLRMQYISFYQPVAIAIFHWKLFLRKIIFLIIDQLFDLFHEMSPYTRVPRMNVAKVQFTAPTHRNTSTLIHSMEVQHAAIGDVASKPVLREE